ncbi:serine protease, partial [Staphylococcus pasteuri_A]|nr:serine protease [Staphylococcus pasteuri_A]
SKVNEVRVKDNLRKARIEKLTKDVIQQQQTIASQSSNKMDTDQDSSSHNESKLTLPEEQKLKRSKNQLKDNTNDLK